MVNKVKIKEIFSSIQGEGKYIGYKQVFVRFCKCNLSCKYCDTDFVTNSEKDNYSAEELAKEVNKNKDCHSVSLTGGEPLLFADFLQEFLPLCKLPVYLETNSTLTLELKKIIDRVDYVSADIKLPSCTGLNEMWNIHDEFFEAAKAKNLFAKVVFDENITQNEIEKCSNLAKKHNIELILQPKTDGEKLNIKKEFIELVFDKFLKCYDNVRLIPQVHKFLEVR